MFVKAALSTLLVCSSQAGWQQHLARQASKPAGNLVEELAANGHLLVAWGLFSQGRSKGLASAILNLKGVQAPLLQGARHCPPICFHLV